jgi:hypothetical protein
MSQLSQSDDSTMSNGALPTYLQDHLAGALHAIELLKAMRDHFSGEPLGSLQAKCSQMLRPIARSLLG